jgi:hypothetical protein
MDDPQPAEGKLAPDLLRDLINFREFLAMRDEAMRKLLGRNMAPSRLRDEIVRLALIEFGHGRHNRLSFYQRELTGFAGRFAVRDEVHRLSKIGVLVLENDPNDQRAIIVRPSRVLVSWCVEYTRILRDEIRRWFLDTPDQLRNG